MRANKWAVLDSQVILIIESNNEHPVTSIKVKSGKGEGIVLNAQELRLQALTGKSFKCHMMNYFFGLYSL